MLVNGGLEWFHDSPQNVWGDFQVPVGEFLGVSSLRLAFSPLQNNYWLEDEIAFAGVMLCYVSLRESKFGNLYNKRVFWIFLLQLDFCIISKVDELYIYTYYLYR